MTRTLGRHSNKTRRSSNESDDTPPLAKFLIALVILFVLLVVYEFLKTLFYHK